MMVALGAERESKEDDNSAAVEAYLYNPYKNPNLNILQLL